MTATLGKIGQFSIDEEGLYSGNQNAWSASGGSSYTPMSKLGIDHFRVVQAKAYSASQPVEKIMAGIGAGAYPARTGEANRCDTALYVYRKRNSSMDEYWPGVIFESDNVVNRDIALRCVGGLQVWGGVIERGHVLSDANTFDLSFGTNFLIGYRQSFNTYYLPSASLLRQQIGVGSGEMFFTRFTIMGHGSLQNPVTVMTQGSDKIITASGNSFSLSANDAAEILAYPDGDHVNYKHSIL